MQFPALPPRQKIEQGSLIPLYSSREGSGRESNSLAKYSFFPENIDHFHKWWPIIDYFESIKISLTNLILKLVIEKNFYSETRLARLSTNLNAYKRILN